MAGRRPIVVKGFRPRNSSQAPGHLGDTGIPAWVRKRIINYDKESRSNDSLFPGGHKLTDFWNRAAQEVIEALAEKL